MGVKTEFSVLGINLTSPTIFNCIRKSEFSLLKGATVVNLPVLGKFNSYFVYEIFLILSIGTKIYTSGTPTILLGPGLNHRPTKPISVHITEY